MAKANMNPSLYFAKERAQKIAAKNERFCHAIDSFCCNLANVSKALSEAEEKHLLCCHHSSCIGPFVALCFVQCKILFFCDFQVDCCTLSRQKRVWRAPSGCVRSGTTDGAVWFFSPRAARGVESNQIKSNLIGTYMQHGDCCRYARACETTRTLGPGRESSLEVVDSQRGPS